MINVKILMVLMPFLIGCSVFKEVNDTFSYSCGTQELTVPIKVSYELPELEINERVKINIKKYSLRFEKYLEFVCKGDTGYLFVYRVKDSYYIAQLSNKGKLKRETFRGVYN